MPWSQARCVADFIRCLPILPSSASCHVKAYYLHSSGKRHDNLVKKPINSAFIREMSRKLRKIWKLSSQQYSSACPDYTLVFMTGSARSLTKQLGAKKPLSIEHSPPNLIMLRLMEVLLIASTTGLCSTKREMPWEEEFESCFQAVLRYCHISTRLWRLLAAVLWWRGMDKQKAQVPVLLPKLAIQQSVMLEAQL